MKRVIGAALAVVMAGIGIGGHEASATHPGGNGLILLNDGSLRKQDGTSVRSLLPGIARFNAQGDRLYYSQSDFAGSTTKFRWLANNGQDEQFASHAGFLSMDGISTDGSEIVASDDFDHIYAVGTDGNGWHEVAAHAVYTADPDFKPSSHTIAFIRGNDVFTASTSGGAASQWTDECTYTEGQEWYECGDGTTVEKDYRNPRWSPDGTKVVVYVEEHEPWPSDVVHRYIGILAAGATSASHLVDLPQATGQWTVPYYVWSPDGSKIVYSTGNQEVFTIPAGGGASTKVLDGHQFPIDWQPCPSTCASWAPRINPDLVLGFSNIGRKVTARVWVNPPAPGMPQPTGNVTVILQKSPNWAGGKWKYVNRRVIAVPPNFVVRFNKPTGGKACRFIVRYDGDDNYYGAKTVRWLTC